MCLCIRAALTRVPCWLQSAFFCHLYVSRYRRFLRVWAHRLTHTHKHTHRHAQSQGHTDTHTHTCPLPLPLSVFVLPLADFVFAGNRWADIDSLVDNKYTLLSLALSFSDISLSLSISMSLPTLCAVIPFVLKWFIRRLSNTNTKHSPNSAFQM